MEDVGCKVVATTAAIPAVVAPPRVTFADDRANAAQ